jgi:hypothetical protein
MNRGSSDSGRGWYRLTSLFPGERVPFWLHSGQTYRGVPLSGGQVKICAPDADLWIVVPSSMLREVHPPTLGQALKACPRHASRFPG